MTKRESRLVLAVANVVGFVAVVVVNVLAVTLPIAGKDTGQLSDQYPNLFVPAGLTFSIWGVIYLALAAFVAYGLVFPLQREAPAESFMERIGALFLVTCAANIGWIFSWHYELLPLSLLLMVLLLGSLIALYLRLDIGRSGNARAVKYLIHLPVSLYLGWISIATIANVTALLVAYHWGGFGAAGYVWAVSMMGVGIALAAVMLFLRRDLFYSLVVDWALLGIYLKRVADRSEASRIVAIAALCGLALVSAAILVQLVRRRVYR